MNKQEFQDLLNFGMSPAQIISTALNDHLSNAAQRLAMIVYGSSVYKNKTPSDIDVKIIVDKKIEPFELVVGDYNIHVVSFCDFLNAAANWDVVTIECIFAPGSAHLMACSPIVEEIIRNVRNNIKLSKLRESFSSTASNSYVKAKKKLIVPESRDVVCSYKSMWHSLRILAFGASIATNKCIDFQEMNDVYNTVLETYQDADNNWDEIHEIIRPVFNHYASEFRQVAPKEDENDHFARKMQSSHGDL